MQMEQYAEFSKELVGRYMAAQEETNELYKKRYIPVGSEKLLEIVNANHAKPDDDDELRRFYDAVFKDSGISCLFPLRFCLFTLDSILNLSNILRSCFASVMDIVSILNILKPLDIR